MDSELVTWKNTKRKSEWLTIFLGRSSFLYATGEHAWASALHSIYIWDLNINNIQDLKVHAKIYNYVDYTKVLTKVTTEDDIEN